MKFIQYNSETLDYNLWGSAVAAAAAAAQKAFFLRRAFGAKSWRVESSRANRNTAQNSRRSLLL
jgi:hypothetical protein